MVLEGSILKTTKKLLGLAPDYTPFDQDVVIFINSIFSVLEQLGIGPIGGLTIEGSEEEWSLLGVSNKMLNMIKTFVYLKGRQIFDPPATSFSQQALQNQIDEHAFRLSVFREELIPLPDPPVEEEEPVW